MVAHIVFEPELSQTPSPGKPKQTRISLQKVRTGCTTCKKRHIKCDEAKPHCNNCLRGRRQCEGYVIQQKATGSGPAQVCWDSKQRARVGVPPGAVVAATRSQSSPKLELNLELNPDSVDFPSATSMFYFEEFVNLVQNPWVAGPSRGDWWREMLPQLARGNQTLRHVAMGIGALSMWHRQSKRISLRAATSAPDLFTPREGHADYLQAVVHYCHALKLHGGESSVSNAVFLSVLLVCFETLRGSKKAALAHINHGLALFLALLLDGDLHQEMAALGPNPKPLLDAVADIFVHLATQARTVLPGKIGNGPPLPNFLKALKSKNQTIESFMVLLSQVQLSSATVDDIPSSFTTFEEFESYWMAARSKHTALGPVMIEVIQDSGVLMSENDDIISTFYVHFFNDQRIKKVCVELDEIMRNLDAAFLPLFNRAIMAGPESPTYLRAVHLRLQFVSTQMFENPSLYFDIDGLRSLAPRFREYLSLAEIALRAVKQEVKNPAHQLSLQCGLSFHLLLITLFCRDPLAREQAIYMLKDYPAQDGVWNARAHYAVGLRNRDIERRNATEGTETEQWQRLWRREYVFEEGGDRVVFRYLEKDDVTGEWLLVEEEADIPQGMEEVVWRRRPLTGAGKLLMADLIGL